MKTIFLFSGQGSHYRGMGQKLYESNSTFKKSLLHSNAILKEITGCSLVDELYTNKKEPFDDLLVTHPAIVAVEIAMLRTLENMDIFPDYLVGNSLGEFAAAVGSGVWSHEDAMITAIEQAKSFIRDGVEGGMIAIIDTKREEMEALYSHYNLYLASDNYDSHFTLSGKNENLDSFQQELDKMKATFLRLPIAYPFHSPLVAGAKNDYLYSANGIQLNRPSRTIISGFSNKVQVDFDELYFWNAVTEYSCFPKLLNSLEKFGPCLYIDLGPSGTSATFVKNNLKSKSNSIPFSIMTPFKREIHQLKSLKEQFFSF